MFAAPQKRNCCSYAYLLVTLFHPQGTLSAFRSRGALFAVCNPEASPITSVRNLREMLPKYFQVEVLPPEGFYLHLEIGVVSYICLHSLRPCSVIARHQSCSY